jgi:hypothetical protein
LPELETSEDIRRALAEEEATLLPRRRPRASDEEHDTVVSAAHQVGGGGLGSHRPPQAIRDPWGDRVPVIDDGIRNPPGFIIETSSDTVPTPMIYDRRGSNERIIQDDVRQKWWTPFTWGPVAEAISRFNRIFGFLFS